MRGFDKCCFSRFFGEVGGKMELHVPLEKKWSKLIRTFPGWGTQRNSCFQKVGVFNTA